MAPVSIIQPLPIPPFNLVYAFQLENHILNHILASNQAESSLMSFVPGFGSTRHSIHSYLTHVDPWFMSHMKQHQLPPRSQWPTYIPFYVLYRTIRVKHRLNLILNPRFSHLAGSFTRHALQPCLYSTPASLLSTISFLSSPHIGLTPSSVSCLQDGWTDIAIAIVSDTCRQSATRSPFQLH